MSSAYSMLVDIKVIHRARDGDIEAFDEIIGAYGGRIKGVVYQQLGQVDDVEDVSQEVLVRLFRSLIQLQHVQAFDSWLYRLTTNTVYDHFRKKRTRRDETLLGDLAQDRIRVFEAARSSKAYENAQRHDRARELTYTILQELRADERLLLTLREFEGLSLRELEELYGVNSNAVKVRLFRARRRARKAYERLQEADTEPRPTAARRDATNAQRAA